MARLVWLTRTSAHPRGFRELRECQNGLSSFIKTIPMRAACSEASVIYIVAAVMFMRNTGRGNPPAVNDCESGISLLFARVCPARVRGQERHYNRAVWVSGVFVNLLDRLCHKFHRMIVSEIYHGGMLQVVYHAAGGVCG